MDNNIENHEKIEITYDNSHTIRLDVGINLFCFEFGMYKADRVLRMSIKLHVMIAYDCRCVVAREKEAGYDDNDMFMT